jgi:hypothetical protein
MQPMYHEVQQAVLLYLDRFLPGRPFWACPEELCSIRLPVRFLSLYS